MFILDIRLIAFDMLISASFSPRHKEMVAEYLYAVSKIVEDRLLLLEQDARVEEVHKGLKREGLEHRLAKLKEIKRRFERGARA